MTKSAVEKVNMQSMTNSTATKLLEFGQQNSNNKNLVNLAKENNSGQLCKRKNSNQLSKRKNSGQLSKRKTLVNFAKEKMVKS